MPQTPLSPREALPRITALLAEGQSCRLTVTGSSMRPFLHHQEDAVILAPLDRPIRRGDILFYLRGPDFPILHRVHKVLPDGTLLMCGDAQTALEPIRPEQVLARATHLDKNGRILSCTSPSQCFLTALWRTLRPVRPRILAVTGRLRSHK